MAATKKSNSVEANGAPEKEVIMGDGPSPEQVILEYQDGIKKKLDKHYNDLLNALKGETNIAVRYELKVQIEELLTTYQLIFK